MGFTVKLCRFATLYLMLNPVPPLFLKFIPSPPTSVLPWTSSHFFLILQKSELVLVLQDEYELLCTPSLLHPHLLHNCINGHIGFLREMHYAEQIIRYLPWLGHDPNPTKFRLCKGLLITFDRLWSRPLSALNFWCNFLVLDICIQGVRPLCAWASDERS